MPDTPPHPATPDLEATLSVQKDATGLRIPEQGEPVRNSFDLHPKKIAQWIAALPMAHISEAADHVIRALSQINQVRLSSPHRSKLLELFHEPLQQISKGLEKSLIDVPLPLSERLQQTARHCCGLQTEMARGYNIIIGTLLSGNALSGSAAPTDSSVLVNALYGALYYLGRAMYYQWLTYRSPSAHDWQELHHLYLHAEQRDLHRLPVAHAFGEPKRRRWIRDIYLHTLLLAVTQPFSLRVREIIEISALLGEWAHKVELGAIDKEHPPLDGYIVDLGSDRPPMDASLYLGTPTERYRYLATEKLADIVQTRLPISPVGQASAGGLGSVSRNTLVKRLHVAWGTHRTRTFTRNRESFRIQLHLGLNGAHEFATRWDDAAQSWKDPIANELEWLEHNLYSLPDPEQDILPSPAPKTREPILRSQKGPASKRNSNRNNATQSGPQTSVVHGNTVDESAGGFSLFWEPTNPPLARVGELFCLENVDNGAPLGVGAIRWIMASSDSRLQLGIEMLAPRAMAANARDPASERKAELALILPEIKALQQPASLLLPPLAFQLGDVLRIEASGAENLVHLTRVIESTGAFTQFQYIDVEKPRARKLKPKGIA